MRDTITPDQNSYKLASQPSVSNEEIQTEQRINQQNLLPTAVSNRFLSDAVSLSSRTIVPFVVTNGTSTTANCMLVDDDNRVIIALPQASIFIGITDIANANSTNQWPTTGVGGGNFPIYFNPFDYRQVANNDQVARITLRNNSGSDQQVLLVIQWKVFTVPTTTINNTTIATN